MCQCIINPYLNMHSNAMIQVSVIGSLGIQAKDKCGFSDRQVGGFDISSGGMILLLITLIILLMIAFTSHSIHSKYYCFLFVMFLVVPLALICAVGIIVNVIFSFVSIVKVVYRDYDIWNPDNINCASPAFFSAFTYVTIEFVLIVIIVCSFFVWYFRQRCHQMICSLLK